MGHPGLIGIAFLHVAGHLREIYVAGKAHDWVPFGVPTLQRSFEMETILVETRRAKGPLGDAGIGEMGMVPTPPAV